MINSFANSRKFEIYREPDQASCLDCIAIAPRQVLTPEPSIEFSSLVSIVTDETRVSISAFVVGGDEACGPRQCTRFDPSSLLGPPRGVPGSLLRGLKQFLGSSEYTLCVFAR